MVNIRIFHRIKIAWLQFREFTNGYDDAMKKHAASRVKRDPASPRHWE